MADYAYRMLTEGQRAARRAARSAPVPPVAPELLAAWETDHYEHSLQLAETDDRDRKRAHRRAMRQIEVALAANGGPPVQTTEE